MVCSAIQPMSCAIHLSLQHNHTLTLTSSHRRQMVWQDTQCCEAPVIHMCDGWYRMTSRPKPIGACGWLLHNDYKCHSMQTPSPSITFSSTCFLSYTHVIVPHPQGMCVALAINSCWRSCHHTHLHTAQPLKPHLFLLLMCNGFRSVRQSLHLFWVCSVVDPFI